MLDDSPYMLHEEWKGTQPEVIRAIMLDPQTKGPAVS